MFVAKVYRRGDEILQDTKAMWLLDVLIDEKPTDKLTPPPLQRPLHAIYVLKESRLIGVPPCDLKTIYKTFISLLNYASLPCSP